MSDTRDALRQRHGPNYRWWVLLTVMIGTVASIMSATIVNVAVPDMSRVFALGQERAQWMSAGFMAAMTVSMLTTPWLLDRFGYRSTYVAVVLLLMAGGIGGGLGSSFEWVLAMRVAEGLAAGVLQPIPGIIIMHAFDRSEQGKAISFFGMGVVLAPAVGPSVGGVLVEAFGWRSIFFVVVPFCLAAVVLARRFLPHSAPGGVPVNHEGRRLDLVGLGLMSLAILSLLNGMVHLHDADRRFGLSLLALSALALAVLVLHQRRTPHPLLRLALFRHPQFAFGGCVAFAYGAALFASTYLVPVFMQSALHFPPSQAGIALMPAGLVLAGAIPVGGRLADRFPAWSLVAVGLALLAVSFALMGTVTTGTVLWVLMLWAIIGRIGLGFVLPSLTLGAMPGLGADAVPQAASVISFLRQLGGATGVGLVGIFLEWRLRVQAAAGGTAEAGFSDTFWLVAALTALALVAALRMRVPRAA